MKKTGMRLLLLMGALVFLVISCDSKKTGSFKTPVMERFTKQ